MEVYFQKMIVVVYVFNSDVIKTRLVVGFPDNELVFSNVFQQSISARYSVGFSGWDSYFRRFFIFKMKLEVLFY